jgi:hypothetical protein
MKLELFLFYVFVIATIFTVGIAVCHLSGYCKFKTYDHWLAPMTLAITLSMWENINK